MNEQSAKEWLRKAWHNLSGAKIFYDANHYTDVTAVEIHYAVEKTLKSLLAYENKKILKTHDLYEISKAINKFIDLKDSIEILDQISEYHIEESYPAFDRKLPPREEIQEVLDFAESLHLKVCSILNINISEIKQ
jgi:HEPN domain-containing protein